MESKYNYLSSSSSSSSTAYSQALLHSVRKPQSKPWKKPIAPLPPTPPRVYTVDPLNFKDLVQELTSAPEFQTAHRLRKMAPSPLAIDAVIPGRRHHHHHEQPAADQPAANNNFSLELDLTPSPFSWCSFPLLSPGALSPLDQTRTSAVL